jgi:hypothetical protein
MGDTIAFVRTELIGAEQVDEVTVAVRDCPVNAISVLPESGRLPQNHHEEREDEEKGGEVSEYQRKQGNSADHHRIKPDNPERLQGPKHDFPVVSDDSDNQ